MGLLIWTELGPGSWMSKLGADLYQTHFHATELSVQVARHLSKYKGGVQLGAMVEVNLDQSFKLVRPYILGIPLETLI